MWTKGKKKMKKDETLCIVFRSATQPLLKSYVKG